jgi:hypothetical protein
MEIPTTRRDHKKAEHGPLISTQASIESYSAEGSQEKFMLKSELPAHLFSPVSGGTEEGESLPKASCA